MRSGFLWRKRRDFVVSLVVAVLCGIAAVELGLPLVGGAALTTDDRVRIVAVDVSLIVIVIVGSYFGHPRV